MAEPVGHRRLLFISNGHGEDSIAAEIIRRLPQGVTAEAYPTIGEGHAYHHVCPIVGPRAKLASEGWRNVKGSVWRDVAGGGLSTVGPALRFGRRVRRHYDRVVVVGDLVGVAGCALLGVKDIVYLDVYKTGYARLYSRPERWLIRRTAAVSFCRSERLASMLRDEGVDARFVGNVMMDTIPRGDYDVAARRSRPMAVTLLPGSRQFTAESFALQVEALRRLPPELRPDIFLAAAGSVSLEGLARGSGLTMKGPMTGEAGDGGTLIGGGLTIHVARGVVGNLIEQSDVVLSQAGTVTIQALGLGRPVITFINARDRRSRVRDENALFGDARITLGPDATEIASTLERLLASPHERERLGAIGRTRIGGPGAIEAILQAI
ncbi:MAG TPA: hypothetical protein VL418_00070 [Devosiaceae bacterium]|nr:hypothetical protein [Devosiaceae bacterium]